jgi:hypothetical protein
MTDRRAQLEALAAEIADHAAVADAFVAKHFSDQLVIVDVAAAATGSGETAGSEEGTVPADVVERLEAAEVRPAEHVYGDEEAAGSPVGPIEAGTRHHFVDVRTRGTHRTEVVE